MTCSTRGGGRLVNSSRQPRNEMKHVSLATRFGLTLFDLSELLKGQVTVAVAARLGVTAGDVKAFIDGRADAAMTKRLGLDTMATTTDLATSMGRESAIGFLVGILFTESAQPPKTSQ
jgi:hypothetical protein